MLEQRTLGQTGCRVGRLGISSSYRADRAVFEEAFEYGCTYFNWGTFIRGRSAEFRQFMQQVVRQGKRQQIFLGLLSYSHSKFLSTRFLHSALGQLGTDYVDGLLLGYFSSRPPRRLLDWSLAMKEQGVVRSIGITTHNRKLVAPLAAEGEIDYFHLRYNAVHRGAEEDVFPHLGEQRPGLVTFTATCWGKLMDPRKMAEGVTPPTAGDCYRYVLTNEYVDVCMMGVKDRQMLRDNLRTIEKGPMSEEEMTRMRDIGDYLYSRPRTSGG